MKTGILYFNQGWSDIINCLSLIDLYSKRYESIFLLIRSDARQLIDYYTNNKSNVICVYVDKTIFEKTFPTSVQKYIDEPRVQTADFLFHGSWDRYRKDGYRNRFLRTEEIHFASSFYQDYGFTENDRIEGFNLRRDEAEEEKFLKSLHDKHGKNNDCVIHDSKERFINLSGIRLDNLTENPFIAIKFLQQMKEIHLIDSFWASICYYLDMKYSLLKDSKITIYPFHDRAGAICDITRSMIQPIIPSNWNIAT